MKLLIYGSYGYTGKLIASQLLKTSIDSVLAGRNENKLKTQSEQSNYNFRVFDLKYPSEIDKNLQDVDLLLNCAGPFSKTAKILVEACLRTKTHYLDITGEIDVFEKLQEYDQQARVNGVMIMPGVAFDVVPTDCLAKYLHEKLPDATSLELAFHGMDKTSPGTTKSQIERLKVGGALRENGEIKIVPIFSEEKELVFVDANGQQFSKKTYLIPWGDISTAFVTTGIPNIKIYQTFAKLSLVKMGKLSRYIRWLLKIPWYEKFVIWIQLKTNPPLKPGEPEVEGGIVRGTVTNGTNTINARVTILPGYEFSSKSGVHILTKVVAGKFKPGFQTPAGCYGASLLQEIPGTSEFIDFVE
jgi:short subunit dehydrogenase-like uncharacterized protein